MFNSKIAPLGVSLVLLGVDYRSFFSLSLSLSLSLPFLLFVCLILSGSVNCSYEVNFLKSDSVHHTHTHTHFYHDIQFKVYIYIYISVLFCVVSNHFDDFQLWKSSRNSNTKLVVIGAAAGCIASRIVLNCI